MSGGESKTEPKFIKPVTTKPGPGTRVNVVANRLTYDGRRKIATATGLVQITYGPYTLTATKVVYDVAKDKMTANGSIVFREPNGNVVESDSATMFNHFKEGFASHLRALLTNDVTITADYARRYENGITIYDHVSYTACQQCVGDDGTPLWQIVAKQTEHDENTHTLYHRDARFELGGVPVMWLPYMSMADPTVKRRSGLLLPYVRSRSTYGIGVVTPYFLNLAPNYDLTFSPMWTTRQGILADVEWRHRVLSGEYNLHAYGIRQADPVNSPDNQRWRGALTSKGDFKLADGWNWGWDGTLVSDRYFLRHYSIDNRSLAASDLYLTGMEGRNYLSAQALHYQSLTDQLDQDQMPDVLPYVRASYVFDQEVMGGELGVDTGAYSLTRSDPDTGLDLGTRQTRSVTDLHWHRQVVNGFGQVITPFARLRSDVYITDNLPGADSDHEVTGRVMPSAGLDMRWPFLSSHDFGQSVLTPVAQVIAATNETDDENVSPEDAVSINFDHTNLFLQDRFSGLDRYEGGTRANAGFVYSLLGENGGFARLSFGESFHLAGKNSFTAGSGLDGPSSDLVGAFALQPWENFRFTYQARAEENLSAINSQETSLSLTFDRIAGSLSYADIAAAPDYGRPDREQQLWGDASLQLSEAWSLFGGLRYDLQSSEFIDKTIGLSFDCDCMNAKLSYSESQTEDPDDPVNRTLKLTVEFRTLGSGSAGLGL